MCAGAIVQSRIRNVFIGAMNPKAGCCGSILDLLHVKEFNHQCEVKTHILEEECASLLKSFFQELRK
jgi:tRNA(adenine34) deaminase